MSRKYGPFTRSVTWPNTTLAAPAATVPASSASGNGAFKSVVAAPAA
jgi:hypothetical protein